MTNRDNALRNAGWFTSSYSNDQGGQCVQAARLDSGGAQTMAVRDSKNPDGPAFTFGSGSWMSFISSLGEAP